jgi:ABC-type transport system involved in multi-copper enzyme maturation permease subunit
MGTESTSQPKKAGAFDIRLIIALLIGVYGVILTVMGAFFTSAAEREKAAGVNINLWAGIGMLVVTALFVIWARVRPLVVPAEPESEDTPATQAE